MSDKLEMPVEQFAEAVAKENVRLNERIEKLETALEHTMECFLGAREALKECVIERNENNLDKRSADRIEKLEKTLSDVIETLDLDYSNEIPYMLRNRYACTIAKLGLGDKK
jgi:tetrahydromethanopterin S-methyltransferase subunit B